MPDILIRDLDAKTVLRLTQMAKRNGRSLQSEVKLLLERAVGIGREQIQTMLDRWNAKLAGRSFASSAELVREDRDR